MSRQRNKEPAWPVSDKAREEEAKMLRRWKGAEQRNHRNVWQKKENDPAWATALEERKSSTLADGPSMGAHWGVRKKLSFHKTNPRK